MPRHNASDHAAHVDEKRGAGVSRRGVLAGVAAAGAGALSLGLAVGRKSADAQEPQSYAPSADYRIEHGKIRQSVMGWCFNPMDTLELARALRSNRHARDRGH